MFFKAKRPSMLLSLSFDMYVDVFGDKSDEVLDKESSALFQWVQRNSGLQLKPALVVSQKMNNYSKFLTEGYFAFALFPKAKDEYVVEVIGWAGVSGSVPGFIQSMMAGEYSDKMLHFRKALGRLLSQMD